jgi:chloramphenicol 3-O phosphotransferase
MREPTRGRVLLLIGPSSVGKTAVAEELQRALPGPWLLAGVDLFWGMLDELTLPVGAFRSDSDVMRRITRGWHRAVAALAAEGNDVLVDELWTHRWWLEDWREVLRGLRWWSVMLTASADTLAAREAERGDRPAGLAAGDLLNPPDPALFDLVLNTGDKSVAECAREIMELISRPQQRE